MSVRKLTANVLTALVLLCGYSTVHAQKFLPYEDPLAFDPDFRWFEPISDMDLADLKPIKRANTGWFATYDRLNLYATRPTLDNPNRSEKAMDGGLGNRYQFGYMIPYQDTGWLLSYTTLGIGGFFTTPRERINIINVDALEGDPTTPMPPFGFADPPTDNNTPGLYQRTYFLQESENVISYESYEIAKTWRMEPFHYGGILEPMIGFRWMRVNDLNAKQQYNSSADIDLVPYDIFGDAEILITDGTFTDNELVTGEVGFRYTKFRDRFTFSSDFRFFTGGSFQSSKSNRLTEITVYDGDGLNAQVTRNIVRQTDPIYSDNDEFTIGFDWRGEVAYQVTRDFSIRMGFQVIDIESGIWRGGSQDPSRNLLAGGPTNQDVLLVGGSLGITLNR